MGSEAEKRIRAFKKKFREVGKCFSGNKLDDDSLEEMKGSSMALIMGSTVSELVRLSKRSAGVKTSVKELKFFAGLKNKMEY